MRHTGSNGSNETTINVYNYDYDDAGRIDQIAEGTGTAVDTINYRYDATHQLEDVNRNGTARDETYRYDANGNRTNHIKGIDNRILSDGTFRYTYDLEGNLRTRTRISNTNLTREFVWDHRNRLTGVIDRNGSTVTRQTTYAYDAMGQRIAKVVDMDGAGAAPAQTTRFVYDRNHVALEFNGTGTTPSIRYLYGPQTDQILAQEAGGSTTWMLSDHLGSVKELVRLNNGVTEVVNRYSYDSFGNIVSTQSALEQNNTRYRYTGREWDAETGIYYYRARYYDASVGRFIGQDPIGFYGGTTNLYSYVENSPLTRIDPSGLSSQELDSLLNYAAGTQRGGTVEYPQRFRNYTEAYTVAWFEFVRIIKPNTLQGPFPLEYNFDGRREFRYTAQQRGVGYEGTANIRTAGEEGTKPIPTIDIGSRHRSPGHEQ